MTETQTPDNSIEKTSVFLDTNVIISYLIGKGKAAKLFDPRITNHTRYFINPIVMQELLLIGNEELRSRAANVMDTNHIEIMELPQDVSDRFLNKARDLRNRFQHTNDLLLLSSASQCDYLVTEDQSYRRVASDGQLQILTTEQFVSQAISKS